MNEVKPRYEFRVWADGLGALHERMDRLAQANITDSQETYLISASTHKCNAKIRAALMDIKVLVAEDQGLEQWRPILKAGFPLKSAIIATQVFSSLELPVPSLPQSAYDVNGFIELMAHTDRIAVVDVRKTRYQYRIGNCSAEYAQITINDVPRDTVAVESVDGNAVLRLVGDLGITSANTSYIREIKRVLGWVSQGVGF